MTFLVGYLTAKNWWISITGGMGSDFDPLYIHPLFINVSVSVVFYKDTRFIYSELSLHAKVEIGP